MKSCFMFGHGDAPCTLQPELTKTVEQSYLQYEVKQFYVGAYGNFDRMAAAAVKTVKKRYPEISLFLLLPYHPAERPIETPDGFDGTYHPPMGNTPRRYAIVKANRYMAETCDTLICYVQHPGNSCELLKYASCRRQITSIRNLIE